MKLINKLTISSAFFFLCISNALAKDLEQKNNYTEENIKDTEKYILYESVYFNLSPVEVIGLHCLLVNEPSDYLKGKYPKIVNDTGFTHKPINNTICTMAKNGLLQFNNENEFKKELKELEDKHKQ